MIGGIVGCKSNRPAGTLLTRIRMALGNRTVSVIG